MTPNTVLPPLPIPLLIRVNDDFRGDWYSPEQMKEYAIAALALRPGGEPSDADLIDLMKLYEASTQGKWRQGQTTHHTVSEMEGKEPYRIAEFHHAADASFCDVAHEWMPKLIAALRPVGGADKPAPMSEWDIVRICNDWKDGQSVADLIRAVEVFHGIKEQS